MYVWLCVYCLPVSLPIRLYDLDFTICSLCSDTYMVASCLQHAHWQPLRVLCIQGGNEHYKPVSNKVIYSVDSCRTVGDTVVVILEKTPTENVRAWKVSSVWFFQSWVLIRSMIAFILFCKPLKIMLRRYWYDITKLNCLCFPTVCFRLVPKFIHCIVNFYNVICTLGVGKCVCAYCMYTV